MSLAGSAAATNVLECYITVSASSNGIGCAGGAAVDCRADIATNCVGVWIVDCEAADGIQPYQRPKAYDVAVNAPSPSNFVGYAGDDVVDCRSTIVVRVHRMMNSAKKGI